ncbi:hypothetical protein U9M48_018052 [Paspalum notatum var. saurae]|uniref:DUF1639 family protein n=1 Tax=Paspalum notatum var. saurae TaxID=547442 RepID=A0AAQ3WPQ3_PASNO
MAATADPRAKPPPAASHHLKPWAPPPPHRVPSLVAVAEGGGARDRRRSSSSSSSQPHRRVGAVAEEPPSEARLEDLRAKLMGHLRDAADRLRLTPPRSSPEAEVTPLPQPTPPLQEDTTPPQAATAARPWNLRDRKCRRPTARGAAAALEASPASSWEPASEKARRRSGPGPEERAPFAVALTAEEVEEDVYALTGARPRRRPRKRPRVVQRQLDTLFPGLWLTEITADAYKVPDE